MRRAEVRSGGLYDIKDHLFPHSITFNWVFPWCDTAVCRFWYFCPEDICRHNNTMEVNKIIFSGPHNIENCFISWLTVCNYFASFQLTTDNCWWCVLSFGWTDTSSSIKIKSHWSPGHSDFKKTLIESIIVYLTSVLTVKKKSIKIKNSTYFWSH